MRRSMRLTRLRWFATGRINPLSQTDAYKLGHLEQYVPNCNKVYSYLQARSTKTFNSAVFFGLQYYLKKYLTQPITKADVDEFIQNRNNILGSTSKDVIDKMYALADRGFWPIEIKAIPEGTVVDNKNVLMTITNTDPDFYWAVGYVESLLLKLWYPSCVATTSFQYRLLVEKYFKMTVDDDQNALKPFMVHDFGYRGDASEEGAVISGIAHLLSFTGSDTIPAYQGAIDYYNADPNKEVIMASVPASEHSVMCSFGRENEYDAYENMLRLYPNGIVSIVSDTYDIYHVLQNYMKRLKPKILARDGKVVIRPDSGNPEHIICGIPDADPSTPEGKGCIRLLDEMFGSTVNSKGFKVLHPKVGLIYGDGMYLQRYERTLERLKDMGYASSNLVIGVGGLLRYYNRDTLGYAIKATKVEVNGLERSIMKDPITDKGKKSHQGYLALYKENGKYITKDDVTAAEEKSGLLQTVFKDGKITRIDSLSAIRGRIEEELKHMKN
jgi:nicotinamide phosphoribosyltransferase